MEQNIPKWSVFECSFPGPAEGNPFLDVQLSATLLHGESRREVWGFYDGEGIYRFRFLPDLEGRWSYVTHSGCPALDGLTGSFLCAAPQEGDRKSVV